LLVLGNWQKIGFLAFACLLTNACSSSFLKHENSDKLLSQSEYEDVMHVKEIHLSGLYVRLPGPEPVHSEPTLPESTKVHHRKRHAKVVKTAAVGSPAVTIEPQGRQPDIEDSTGFIGRRPVVDPFRVGEKTVLELSYFGVVAGDLSMEIKPFVEVNGRKAYHLWASATSTSVFGMVYAVDDWVETFLDYEKMTPFNYALTVKESKQLRTTTSYFDWKALKGFYWDKRITKEKGLEEKRLDWSILDYSQNVFSAVYYLRTFKLEPGQSYSFRVAHEGKNIVVKASVLRRERIETALGPMDTVVIKPTFQIDGVFSPAGDIFFWLTDDDRKFFVRIESKIKIGKIVGAVKKIDKG
jgi:hypothetical protein